MYKDKDKQREAVREATRRYRNKGITDKVSRVSQEQGITEQTDRVSQPTYVIPDEPPLLHKPVAPKKYALHVVPKVKTQSHNPMMVGYVPPGRQ